MAASVTWRVGGKYLERNRRRHWGKVKMPNDQLFDDDRQVTEKAFWNANPCLKDCRPPVKITGHAVVLDVTPDDKATRKGGVE
jgi:hypothetical protein